VYPCLFCQDRIKIRRVSYFAFFQASNHPSIFDGKHVRNGGEKANIFYERNTCQGRNKLIFMLE
jgi:hypothetical protein